MARKFYIHPRALCESRKVGTGTRIWAFAHVLKGAVIGRDCNIGDHAYVEGGAVLGNGVTLKNGVAVWEGVVLEDFVFVGPGVVFVNDRYPRSPRNPAVAGRYGARGWLEPTRVRTGASLGARAVVLCGVTVGTYAMVAAGSVVTRDVPDFGLAAGNPARIVGRVCLCGRPLKGRGRLSCAACGRRYRPAGRGLRLARKTRGEKLSRKLCRKLKRSGGSR